MSFLQLTFNNIIFAISTQLKSIFTTMEQNIHMNLTKVCRQIKFTSHRQYHNSEKFILECKITLSVIFFKEPSL